MARLVKYPGYLLIGMAIAFVGCGDSEPEPVGGGATPGNGAAVADGNEADGQEEMSPSDAGADGSPAGSETVETPTPSASDADPIVSIERVIEGLKQGQPQAMWDFLPASYQDDLNGLIREFAEKMDPELWDRGFGTVLKLTSVLKEKQEFFLANPLLEGLMLQAQVDAGTVSEGWEPTVNFLNVLFESELNDLDALKQFDGKEFLAGTGAKFISELRGTVKRFGVDEDIFENLEQTEFSVIEVDGETATILIEAPDQPAQEHAFVRVENKWIPQEMAAEWDENIAQAKAQLAALSPEVIALQKEEFLGGLDQVDAVLDQLAGAETADEFNQVIGPVLAPAMFLLSGMMMNQGGGGGFPVADDAVLVIVTTPLGEAAETRITNALVGFADDPEEAFAIPRVGELDQPFQVEISPVEDIEAFAEKIEFGKVVKIDAVKRTIIVEVNVDSSDDDDDSEGDATDSDSEESDSEE